MESEDMVAILGGLAEETRLAIFRLLVEGGPTGEIASRLSILATTPKRSSKAAVSR